MKSKHILLVALLIVNIVLCGYLVYNSLTKEKLGYVNLQKVFTEFEYKKELEAKLKKEKELKEKSLDSALTSLRNLSFQLEKSAKPSEKEIHNFREQQAYFQEMKKKVEAEAQDLTSNYDKQIIEQMNQYIMDYGKTQKFHFIFGSDGRGNIMYAHESDEITDEVISFINRKYKGMN